jgi:hypothetical protein
MALAVTPAPVGPATPREQALAALAAELTPAKSLQRLDTATARVVSTVSIVATLLTGLGLITAGLTNLTEAAQVLAIISVGLAFLAVLLALTAQVLTITHDLNTNNLVEVEHWYRRRLQRRGPLTRWATVLLVAATMAAGTAAIITLTAHSDEPVLAVTRTASPSQTGPAAGKLTIDATFRGLEAGQIASVTVTVDGTVLATAAFGPTPDGTATRTVTIEQISTNAVAVVDARGGSAVCTATLEPGQAAEVKCTS